MSQVIRLFDTQRIEVPLNDILFIEGANNYSVLHRIKGKQILSSRTLKRWEEDLPTFVRVHKHYVVNPHHIDLSRQPHRQNLLLCLTTGEELVVSRRRLATIAEAFRQAIERVSDLKKG